MIEKVEHLSAKLQTRALTKADFARHVQIDVEQAGSTQYASPGITETSARRRPERRWVEPAYDAALVGWQSAVSHTVGMGGRSGRRGINIQCDRERLSGLVRVNPRNLPIAHQCSQRARLLSERHLIHAAQHKAVFDVEVGG